MWFPVDLVFNKKIKVFYFEVILPNIYSPLTVDHPSHGNMCTEIVLLNGVLEKKRVFREKKIKKVILTFSMECFIGIERQLLKLRVFFGVAQTIVGSPLL